jgi:hypothetical protein
MKDAREKFIELVKKTYDELNKDGFNLPEEQVFDLMQFFVGRKAFLELFQEIPYAQIAGMTSEDYPRCECDLKKY